MDVWFFVPVLFLITVLGVIVFSLVSKAKLERRMQDPDASKSTLAADKPSTAKPADV
ncbi:hypothetical protein [Tropicimonas sp. S265A]|uniref:hypothetical protein n=1 Tax=Tropicimonas sp. S265A TaxID=3415134 RepID=UPI003C7C9228